MEQPIMVVKMAWTAAGGIIALMVIVSLFAALFSGRFWAILAGVAGTLVLVVGGLFAASAYIFVAGHALVGERAPLPAGDRATIVDASPPKTPPSVMAEAPEPSRSDMIDAPGSANPVLDKADPPPGAPRPAWMDGQMGRVGDVYRTTVKIGPAFSRTECEKQLSAALDEAIRTYADHLLGEDRGQLVELSSAYIQNHLVRGEWEEQRETSYDTVIYLHELLEFDREANEAIEANYRQSVVMRRLAYTAAGGGAVLGLLTVLFGYLKLSTLSRGSPATASR